MFSLDLGDDVVLELVEDRHVDAVFALVDRERARLRTWMRWVDRTTSPDHTRAWVRAGHEGFAVGRGFDMVIVDRGEIVGTAGFHTFDADMRSTSLGWWLAASAEGRGLMTRAVREMCRYAFARRDVHRIEVRARTDNARSRAVAERTGFRFEGVAREAERLDGAFHDLAVYGRLAHDPTDG